MSSEAKRKANAKYLQSMKTLTLRVKPEEAEEIKRAAGNSVQGYIISAVRERMAAESQEGITVYKIRNDAVGPAAEAAGQSIKEYVTQAIQERMERGQ